MPVPLTLLRQEPPDVYRLAAGDTLGVYIDGVLGNADTPPPVNLPTSTDLPPSIGYPIPVRIDGTISLPLVGSIPVAGLTIDEAEQKVVEAFTSGAQQNGDDGANEGFLREESQILVSLMRPRHVRVLVIRDDSQQRQTQLRTESLLGLGSSETTIGGGVSGTGQSLELPAYQNDVLNALTRTGGLPGLESTQEVIIQRGYWDQTRGDLPTLEEPPGPKQPGVGAATTRITRIPMRIRPGQTPGFGPEDILLFDGDILTVRAREPQFYYTGGFIPAGEYPLPNNYDLTVVEAVLKSRGPLFSGGQLANNLSGSFNVSGLGNPSPNLVTVLRRTPQDGQVTILVDLAEAARDPRQNLLVQAGDVLILQEFPDQAIGRYFSQVFQVDLFTRFLNRGDAQGSAAVTVP
ncbi:MAG: polysaccharide biosynthesis/export family protein [Pirellulales bacterium]|nr:polysaccharide biosynthesis/export family protein [Pirellulales bacterium]